MDRAIDRDKLGDLLERVRSCREADNALDIEIDIALFEPDIWHGSVRANAAGTKLVYARHDGRTDTYWAADHTFNDEARQHAAGLITALLAQEQSK